MEKLLETLSFEASDESGKQVVINADYVNDHLGNLIENDDLTRYIL